MTLAGIDANADGRSSEEVAEATEYWRTLLRLMDEMDVLLRQVFLA
jgi:hypothetical protein